MDHCKCLSDKYIKPPLPLTAVFSNCNSQSWIFTFTLKKNVSLHKIKNDLPEFLEAEKATKALIDRLLNIKGNQSVESFHRRLGKIMWEYCGMARNEEGLKKAKGLIKELKTELDGRGGDINSGIAVAPIDWVLKEWNMMGANPNWKLFLISFKLAIVLTIQNILVIIH